MENKEQITWAEMFKDIKDGKPLMPPDFYKKGGYSPQVSYVEHLHEEERKATENYIEYCKYAQRLQTELSEGSIFIQDRLNELSMELAGIEEDRIKLDVEEQEAKRKIAYLKTLDAIIRDRKQELNKEYVETEKARNSSNTKNTGRTEMDKE